MRTIAPTAALVLAALSLGAVLAGPAVAAPDKPGARPATAPPAAKPGAVPADVRARVVSRLQGASPNAVSATPIPGLYEVTMGGIVAYVSADGKYLVSGNVYDLDSQTNITATRRNAARAAVLAAAREDFERRYIAKKHEACHGNMSRTAEALGVERSYLYKKMKALGLIAPKKGAETAEAEA